MICSRCHLPIPSEVEPHWDHEPDCGGELERCWCDLVVHPACCSTCARERQAAAA